MRLMWLEHVTQHGVKATALPGNQLAARMQLQQIRKPPKLKLILFSNRHTWADARWSMNQSGDAAQAFNVSVIVMKWKVPANDHWSGRRHRDQWIQTTPPWMASSCLTSGMKERRQTVTQTQRPIHTLFQSRKQRPEHFQGDEKNLRDRRESSWV